MRVLWIDRILEIRLAHSARVRLELPPGDPIFSFHFPLRPVLPASVLLEAFAQAGTFLVEISHDFTRKGLPGYISSAKFHHAIEPGAALDIEVIAEQWNADGAVIRGRAEQSGTKRATCTFGMFTAPLSDFYGAEHMPTYRGMYERLLDGAVVDGFDRHPLVSLADVLA